MLSKQSILTVAVILNTIIFLLLSVLHFYWTLGGKVWYDDVLPTSSNGLNKFNPGSAAPVIIASGFLLLSLITAGNNGLFDKYINRRYFRYGALIIAFLFFSRSIGDFKFFGFFKTVTATRFGVNDTQIFSPLCLFVALLSLLIFILSRKNYSAAQV